MAVQYSVTVNNARLDAEETAMGTSVKLRFYSGSMPANCATAASGSLLAELSLPSDWMANASAGVKSKTGTWSGSASAAGTAGYFRIYDSTGATCHMQGTVTATGGGGDMTVDNTVFASSQSITVNTFQVTAGNA